MTLKEAVSMDIRLDEEAMERAKRNWDSIAKPLDSLGLLEKAIIRIAGIGGTPEIDLSKKAVAIFCGDNGIVSEGVTQTGQEVTAVVTENFSRRESCVCLMAKEAGAYVLPVDLGVAGRLKGAVCEFPLSIPEEKRHVLYPIWDRKLALGTKNFLEGPAMARELTIKAVECGMETARLLKERGFRIIAAGEMGIGNTTTSSAVSAVLLGMDPREVTGRGAGLSREGLERKIAVIREGIEKNRPDRQDAIDVLSKVGGFDLAGLAGLMIGGAVYRIPVILDGFITGAAALAAVAICPAVREFILASHVSAEPAGTMVLERLGLEPVIHGRMCLGEGTGAVALLPLLSMAETVYRNMSTFQEIEIKEYQHFL